MDHRSFVAKLPPDMRQALTRRNNLPGLFRLGVHGGTILLFGSLIAAGVPHWWVLVLPQGVALAFLFTLQHETTHGTPFANQTLNEAIGHFCGLLIVQPFLWFRYFHLAHHRHTNDPASDPELRNPKPENWRQFLDYLSTIGYWRDKVAVLFRNAFARPAEEFVPESAKPRIQLESRLLLLIYCLIFLVAIAWYPVIFRAWLLPLAVGFPFLRLYLLAEHGLCPPVANMFANTRTTLTSRLVRFLAWNMPYHTEHHVMPQVPFHQLPRLHRLAVGQLCNREKSYTGFTRKYIRQFH